MLLGQFPDDYSDARDVESLLIEGAQRRAVALFTDTDTLSLADTIENHLKRNVGYRVGGNEIEQLVDWHR